MTSLSRRALRIAPVALVLLACSAKDVAPPAPSSIVPSARPTANERAAQPTSALHFEPNKGQFASSKAFVARTRARRIEFTSDEVRIVTRGRSAPASPASEMRSRFANAASVSPIGEAPLKGVSNYLIGNDPARWVKHVSHFERVRYPGIYPGIDAVYYGAGDSLEYDFEVAPDADPSRIAIEFPGAEKVWLDAEGSVHVLANGSETKMRSPVSYQLDGTNRRAVYSRYTLEPNSSRVRIALGTYDRQKALVIDPILDFSTYLGGTSPDFATTVALDASGNIYLAGNTQSLDFPFDQAIDAVGDGADFFVTKFAPDAHTILYSTYLGGTSAEDAGVFLAVDASGSAVLAGSTSSTNFPTTPGVVQPVHGGAGASTNLVIASLTPAGDTFTFSTFLGGASSVTASGVAVNAAGDVAVLASTSAADFPTANALRSAPAGSTDAVVAKLTGGGTIYAYSTYLGGTADDMPSAIAMDAAGNVFVGGTTSSSDFPTTVGSYSPSSFGGRDVFVSKLTGDGSSLAYSTYVGGTSDDVALAMTLTPTDAVLIGGYTSSINFPTTAGAPKRTLNGGVDGFATVLDDTGSLIALSTYVGGASPVTSDAVFALGIENTGAILIAGSTMSLDFPLTVPSQSSYGGNQGGLSPHLTPGDAFLSRLDPSNGQYTFSTFLGGSGDEAIFSLASDSVGSIYVAGSTTSLDFPLRNAVDPTFNGGVVDTFFAKFSSCNADYGALGAPPTIVVCETAQKPACELGSRTCVECTLANKSACTTEKPFCDLETHACVSALKDTDGDGINDETENTLGTDPFRQDSDGDGLTDAEECSAVGHLGPFVTIDTDDDGWIDALDTDSDNDSVSDSLEKNIDNDGDGTSNFRDTDDDGDALLTRDEVRDTRSIDASNDVDGDSLMNWYDVDADGDGKTDTAEGRGDTDRDGVPDYLDPFDRLPTLDSDSDGLSDEDEIRIGTNPHQKDSDFDLLDDAAEAPGATPIDSDGDGIIDALDTDDDNDGIATRVEVQDAITWRLGDDIDADGLHNWLDTNADGDLKPDALEGVGDSDVDGIPNYLDVDDATRIRLEGGGISCASSTSTRPTSRGAAFVAALIGFVLTRRTRSRRAQSLRG